MLDDLRVAELSCTYAGAIAGRLMVDAGADVILVEPPGGHPLRMHGPFRGDVPDPETCAWHLHANAGKRSVVIDLGSDPEPARRVVLSADVFITDLPGAELERLGLTWGALQRRRPGLLMAQISPFGDTGPYRHYVATNLVEMALGGQLKITGDPGRSPLCNFGAQAEYQSGLAAFAGVLANLLLRDETGEGAYLDLSVQDMVANNLEGRSLTFNLGVMAERAGLNVSAVYGVYPCADGWVFLSAFAPALWEQLKDAARLPELDDERFSTQAGRLEHNDELQAILTAWTLSQTGDDLRRFSQKGYPVTVAETPDGLLRSEQWATRGFVNQVDHPAVSAAVLGPLWQNEGIRSPRPAPCLGEGNEEILAALKGVA
ncbi:MAG TPA: CoA transferase [Dehalococcoidia bacterium]|nr:CoA transferase [Dehalococcoidia bacterium]